MTYYLNLVLENILRQFSRPARIAMFNFENTDNLLLLHYHQRNSLTLHIVNIFSNHFNFSGNVSFSSFINI